MIKFPNRLWILVFLLIVTTACQSAQANSAVILTNTPVFATNSHLPLTKQALENLEYSGIYDQAVKLSGGEYTGPPFVKGVSSHPTITLQSHAFGDLNQDGVSDAVIVLAENSGGSGTFIYLSAILNENGVPVNTSTFLLGDRVKVQSLQVVDNQIKVIAVTHASKDPLCCPTQEMQMTYILEADQLIPFEIE